MSEKRISQIVCDSCETSIALSASDFGKDPYSQWIVVNSNSPASVLTCGRTDFCSTACLVNWLRSCHGRADLDAIFPCDTKAIDPLNSGDDWRDAARQQAEQDLTEKIVSEATELLGKPGEEPPIGKSPTALVNDGTFLDPALLKPEPVKIQEGEGEACEATPAKFTGPSPLMAQLQATIADQQARMCASEDQMIKSVLEAIDASDTKAFEATVLAQHQATCSEPNTEQ